MKYKRLGLIMAFCVASWLAFTFLVLSGSSPKNEENLVYIYTSSIIISLIYYYFNF